MKGWVQCKLCPRECVLAPGQRGDCRSRINYEGRLVTLVYGKVVSANPHDPVEKKPLFHFLPGTRCFSIATAGCNLHCKFCQNYEISQLNPDEASEVSDLPPAAVVDAALRFQCRSIAYTYSEPMTFFEYTRDTQALARAKGVKNVLVTAGYINEAPLRDLCRNADAFDDPYLLQIDHITKSILVWQEVLDHEQDFLAYWRLRRRVSSIYLHNVILDMASGLRRRGLQSAVGYRFRQIPFERKLNAWVHTGQQTVP